MLYIQQVFHLQFIYLQSDLSLGLIIKVLHIKLCLVSLLPEV